MSSLTAAKPPLRSIAPLKSHLDLLSFLSGHDIQYVRIQWVDYVNVVRCRVLSVSHFRKLLGSERPAISLPGIVLGLFSLQIAPGFITPRESIYAFDLSSVRTCHYAPRHAALFGFFQEKLPVPRPTGPSIEFPHCPRTVLSRLLKYAAKELGVRFLIGFESEFILLKSTNPIVAVNVVGSQFSTTNAFMTGSIEAQVLEEIADAIQADNIELEMYHREAAPGQYEVVTGPLLPLEAVDALVHTREIIFNIANKHGLKATFAPRPFMESCGTGAHMHVSVHGDGLGLPESNSEFLFPLESAFLSGLMHHLASVIAFTFPTSASYARMMDGVWSGGTWVHWGVEQREAPVRLTSATSPSSRRFEIRTMDGTACPYLAVAAVLACGILGIRDKLELGVKNCDVTNQAAKMSPEEREVLGITKRLPLNLEQAREFLAGADAIKDILGAEVVDRFLEINPMSEKASERREDETEAQALARFVENF